MSNLVTCLNCSVGYGSRTILSNINMDINEGDLIFLYGVNGSGKSTFLKSLSYQDNVRVEGQLKFSDTIPHRMHSDIRREVVYINQNETMDLDTTIYDYFSLPYDLGLIEMPNGMKFSDALESYFEKNNLTKLFPNKTLRSIYKEKVGKLSFGQQHMISMYSSLFGREDKRLFLFDEPLNFLDYENGRNVLNKITELHLLHPNAAIIVCSHCLSVTNITKYFSIKNGEIIQGTIPDIKYSCFGLTDNYGYYI